MPRGRTVVLPLHLLPPIVREYPEIANQLLLRHCYITRLEAGRGEVHEVVLRPLISLRADYEDLFVICPLLLQQLQTTEMYLRGLLHCRASTIPRSLSARTGSGSTSDPHAISDE